MYKKSTSTNLSNVMFWKSNDIDLDLRTGSVITMILYKLLNLSVLQSSYMSNERGKLGHGFSTPLGQVTSTCISENIVKGLALSAENAHPTEVQIS